jgi:uncharacterized protein YuzE
MEKVEIDNSVIKLLLEWKKPSVWIDYDREVDVLYISFEKPQKAEDSVMADDGKIYHYKAEEVVGITIPNASKIGIQHKAA